MEVCTPQIETICEDVTRTQMYVKDNDYCYDNIKTVCTPRETEVPFKVCEYYPDPVTEETEVIVKDLSGNIISSFPLNIDYTTPNIDEEKICDDEKFMRTITSCKDIVEQRCFNLAEIVPEISVFKNCWPKIISNCTVQETECTLA
jgi:hypothetical protein